MAHRNDSLSDNTISRSLQDSSEVLAQMVRWQQLLVNQPFTRDLLRRRGDKTVDMRVCLCSQALFRRDCLRRHGGLFPTSPSSSPSNLGQGGGSGDGKGSVDGGSGIIAYFGKTLSAASVSGSSEEGAGGEGRGGLWWRRTQRLLLSSSATPPPRGSESRSAAATFQAIPPGVCARARPRAHRGVCVCVCVQFPENDAKMNYTVKCLSSLYL
jgi:hypothetical protein